MPQYRSKTKGRSFFRIRLWHLRQIQRQQLFRKNILWAMKAIAIMSGFEIGKIR